MDTQNKGSFDFNDTLKENYGRRVSSPESRKAAHQHPYWTQLTTRLDLWQHPIPPESSFFLISFWCLGPLSSNACISLKARRRTGFPQDESPFKFLQGSICSRISSFCSQEHVEPSEKCGNLVREAYAVRNKKRVLKRTQSGISTKHLQCSQKLAFPSYKEGSVATLF